MRVIDHHDGPVFLREIAKLRERADVAIHGEDAVADQQLASGLIFHAGELLFRVGDIFVVEDENLGARESSAVDD